MRTLLLPLFLLAACPTASKPAEDTGGAGDTAATDTAAPESCDYVVMDPVDAAAVALDWTAYMPVDTVAVLVYAATASETADLLCADALVQSGILDFDNAEAPTNSSASLALDDWAGAALVVSVTDTSGDHLWIADIQSGGAATLTLE